MTCYSIEPRNQKFVKGYELLCSTKTMSKIIGKNTSKKLIGKYSQKFPGHAEKSATDILKTISEKVIQKTAEATGDLSGNKIAKEITKISKSSSQNSSETIY